MRYPVRQLASDICKKNSRGAIHKRTTFDQFFPFFCEGKMYKGYVIGSFSNESLHIIDYNF